MSKKLKKLVDINGLREFKNKLVGTDSAYVQTGAVDQTIAGTKTFSKPIVGSVTGSSGSCTGNAASATNATYANWLRTSSHTDHLFHTEWDNAGYFWTYVTAGDGGYRAVRVARSDSSGNADTATKLATKRTIALSGAATGTATGFDGSGNITIPVTSLDASKLTGTASVSTTGNAATATRANSAANADTATNAATATNSFASNQLQAFVNDNFTEGNHYVKAIRSSYGWSTHLWMCYNNGGKMADEVSVNYANSAGHASSADSSTNATYANWLRTSSHTDHLFHTEWDNAGYFWTYVTTGGGEYRAVRVERANSASVADNGIDSSGRGWIRFKCGIQICWAAIPTNESRSPVWTYSAIFSSDPVVTVCDQGSDNNIIYLTRAADIKTTSCRIVMVDVSGGNYRAGLAQCIAIGRWK